MKTTRHCSFFPFMIVCLLSISLSSCMKDSCEKTYEYVAFAPVYMTEEELRASITMLPARSILNPGKIFYKPPYLFVNELNEGIHIINNSDPSNPQNISFINIPGNLDIAVQGDILYVDSYIDLVTLNISDPLNVVEVSRDNAVFPNRVYEGYSGDPAKGIVVDWIAHDATITEECGYTNWGNSGWFGENLFIESDIIFNNSGDGLGSSSGSGATASSPGFGIAGSMARFAITNDYLYCVTPESMELFDISNPASPQQGVSITSLTNVETIFPYNNYLFIGTNIGVHIYENTVPETPVFISTFEHTTSCDPVVVSGTIAYSTLRSGTECGTFNNDRLDLIDVSDVANPILIETYPMTNPFGLGIDGEKLFLCDGGGAGLKMFNVSDPTDIELLQTIQIDGPYDVIPANGLLIVVGEHAIYQYDYTSGTMELLSEISVLRSNI